MSTRQRLEKEVSMAEERIKNAPEDTPPNIKKLWEEELVQLSFELNNYVDEDDNND